MSIFKTRLITLVKQIRYHAGVYYREDRSEISDADYDLLVQEYHQLISEHPDLLTDDVNLFKEKAVPLDSVDSGFEKVTHEPPMLSLDNVFTTEQHLAWVARLEAADQKDLANEWKFDGIALRLVYEDGELNQIITRGTGLVGEDVTDSLPYFKNIPTVLPEDFTDDTTIIIDGEGVIELSIYHELNQVVPTPYVTPRHAASGITRNRSLGDVVNGTLTFVAHSFPRAIKSDYESTLNALRMLGFTTCGDYPVPGITTDRPEHLPFAVDGIVTKIRNHEARDRLGATAHHPRWAIAYKFPTLTASPKLEDVIWETGRTGPVTPVATFSPVQIAGVTVQRATLHNFRTFQRESEGLRVGSTITVGMAGDIIPQFFKVETVGKGRMCKPPKSCPSCGEPLHYEGADEEQVFLTCTNHSGCPAQTFGRLYNFGSEHAMNIRGLGPATIKSFADRGLLTDFVSLYFLRQTTSTLVLTKAEEKLLDEIDKSRNTNYTRFITALGINGVAKGTARLLAEQINDNEEFISLLTDTDSMMEIPDIGFGIAMEVASYISKNKPMIEQLLSLLTFESISVPKDLIPVCVTGKFPFPRRVIEAELLTKGVEVTNTVNGKTKLVVLGEHYTKHKETSANDLEIPVILISVHPELTVVELVETIMGRV